MSKPTFIAIDFETATKTPQKTRKNPVNENLIA